MVTDLATVINKEGLTSTQAYIKELLSEMISLILKDEQKYLDYIHNNYRLQEGLFQV